MRFPRAALGLVLAVTSGLLAGIGGYTFTYGHGWAYFSREPEACANCHIMRPQLASWQKGGHHHVAACVDCHLPHDFVGKWLAKGENGWNHSWAFTFQDFHEPIQIKEKNRRILQDNCVACHGAIVDQMLAWQPHEAASGLRCVHCHERVGHGP